MRTESQRSEASAYTPAPPRCSWRRKCVCTSSLVTLPFHLSWRCRRSLAASDTGLAASAADSELSSSIPVFFSDASTSVTSVSALAALVASCFFHGLEIAPQTASAAAWRSERPSLETRRDRKSVESRSKSALRSVVPFGEPSSRPTASLMALDLAASFELLFASASSSKSLAASISVAPGVTLSAFELLEACCTRSSSLSHCTRLSDVRSVERSEAMPSAEAGESERRTAHGIAIS
mmetsp:Transcript_94852/g.178469  ORF Transcript_94852/g.178469 Transcript_94852/m.178469 type:complete len:237 (+) Transcript_94852:291-1001(+)